MTPHLSANVDREVHGVEHPHLLAVRGVQNFNILQYFPSTITLKSPMAGDERDGSRWGEGDGGRHREMEADTERKSQKYGRCDI